MPAPPTRRARGEEIDTGARDAVREPRPRGLRPSAAWWAEGPGPGAEHYLDVRVCRGDRAPGGPTLDSGASGEYLRCLSDWVDDQLRSGEDTKGNRTG